MNIEELKTKAKIEIYEFKKFLRFLFESPLVCAKNINPEIELRDVLGLPLGQVIDFETGDEHPHGDTFGRVLKVFYNPKINQIITLAVTNDYFILKFYSALKISSKLNYSEAIQIFKGFVSSLDTFNDTIPIIPIESAFYSLFLVNSEPIRRNLPTQKRYIQNFSKVREDTAFKFDLLVKNFSSDYEIHQLNADDFKKLLRPRRFVTKGRPFPFNHKKENLCDEICACLSEIRFTKSHFYQINGNSLLGVSNIDGRDLKTCVYAFPLDKKHYEIKMSSIYNFTIKAREENLLLSNQYSNSIGETFSNSADLRKTKEKEIDVNFLNSVLNEINAKLKKFIKPIAINEIYRTTSPNHSSKYRFKFDIVIKDLVFNQKGDIEEFSKFYVNHYKQAVKKIFVCVDLVLKKFDKYIEREEFETYTTTDAFEDPILKAKRFDYYQGAFTNQGGDKSVRN